MAISDGPGVDSGVSARCAGRWQRFRRVPRAVIACVAGLLAIASLWVVHVVWGGNLHCVAAEQVYRSAQPTPAMLAELQQRVGVRSVINLRGEWPDEDWYQAEKQAAQELGLRHVDVWLRTHRLAPLAEIRKLIAAFDSCPKPVLIHCRQGADRAGLAAAIYLMLYEGQSLEKAMWQYAPWYGHLHFAHGWRLPHLFDCYRDWLAAEKSSHSPAEFRRWVDSESAVGYFGASLTTNAPLHTAVPGRDALVFQVQNTSRYPWQFSDPATDAIHFQARFTHHGTQQRVFARAAGPKGTVLPGQTIKIEMPVPAELTDAGAYGVFIDLQDANGIHFSDMGTGGCPCDLIVQRPGAREEVAARASSATRR